MANRSPFVPMRTDLVKDERVQFIADVCGYSRDEVIGKLFRLWAWCIDRKLEDAPDDCAGYAVHPAVVRRFLGPEGARALTGDGCAELALGDPREDGLIFLHGTEQAVASLRGLYRRAQAGGEGRVKTATRDNGRFVASPTNTPATGPATATVDPDPDPDQKRERALTRSSEPGPEGRNQGRQGPAVGASSPPAEPRGDIPGAIVPAMSPRTSPHRDNPRTLPYELGPGYDPENAAHRGRLAASVYKRVSDARVAIAAELGLPEQLPFPIVAPSSRAGSFRELLDRVREEGAAAPAACDRVVQNLVDQARETQAIEWLAEKAFTEGGWRTARAWVSKKPKPRPRRAPEQPPPREPELSDEDRAELAELARRVSTNVDAAVAGERARIGPARARRDHDEETDDTREATS